jgi:uncharacterized damage-inducible protein DinB
MYVVALIILVALTVVPAQAQAQGTALVAKDPNPVVASLRKEWQTVDGYITKAAEQLSEADYAFRPTPAVRTFGQLIGHLAGSQFLICSSALAETPKGAEDDIEKSKTTKADLVAALKQSTEFCNRAYAQSDAASGGATKLFGDDATRLAALVRNTVHDGEHYGNIVTYMRMKGMVPPSSQPAAR